MIVELIENGMLGWKALDYMQKNGWGSLGWMRGEDWICSWVNERGAFTASNKHPLSAIVECMRKGMPEQVG